MPVDENINGLSHFRDKTYVAETKVQNGLPVHGFDYDSGPTDQAAPWPITFSQQDLDCRQWDFDLDCLHVRQLRDEPSLRAGDVEMTKRPYASPFRRRAYWGRPAASGRGRFAAWLTC